MKLHLGSGKIRKEGFINIDIDPETNPDKVFDLNKDLDYKDNSVDEILASHLLEHLHRNSLGVLKDWYRMLKKGGKLEVRVPNLEWSAEQIINKRLDNWVLQVIYGEQSNKYQIHLTGFTVERLRNLLVRAGFQEPKINILGDWQLIALAEK